MSWLALAAQIAPLILSFIPLLQRHPAIIPAVAQGIQIAEGIPGASGSDKKNAVVGLVNAGIAAANVERPGTIDQASTAAAVSAGIDATVAAINAIHSINKK